MTHNTAPDFAPFEDRMRREGLSDIAIANFRHYYRVLTSGETGMIPEADIDPVESVPTMEEVAAYREAGTRAVRQAAVLKLNGGLGTSMGLDRAKSLLVARDDLSFLDIIARQNISASQHYNSHIPLLLMNSFNTHADTMAVLERYPELQSAVPLTIMQNKVPKVLQESLQLAEWPQNRDLEWNPPGHGEVYIALATSGVLDTLLEHGYEYLFISNVDNLGATLDLGILGYIAEKQIPFLMEVAQRTEADKKGGHIARQKNGQLILREVAQTPDADVAAFQDIQRHRYFNTNNIWINLKVLKQVLEQHDNVLKLPMIRNAKTLDPKDKQSAPVYQLETAMGAAIAVFSGAQVLQVERSRFLPVKMCSDLLNLRSDNYVLDQEGVLRQNPARTLGPITIDLDSQFYKLIDDFEQRFPHGAPSLVGCARLTVRGDVVFGADVSCSGTVEIVNQSGEQRTIAPHHSMNNARYDLTNQ